MEEDVLHAQLISSAEALKESEKRATAGQLALELMHEIRNPLEALGNLVFLAREDINSSEELRYYMLLAEEQLATLNQLVSHTLSFARFSSHPKITNLVTIAEAALRIHQRSIERKKIHLVKELPADLTAEVYAVEILQVISNLLMNAIDALPDQGVLYVRLRERQDKIYFVIADNGHGIPSEHRDEIFKPFFTTKEDRGTGLGLAISREIVERHRGKIECGVAHAPIKAELCFGSRYPGDRNKPAKASVNSRRNQDVSYSGQTDSGPPWIIQKMKHLSEPIILAADKLANAMLVTFKDGECAIYYAALLYATLPLAQHVDSELGDEFDTEQY